MNLGILINYHTVYIWKVRIFRCKGYECLNQTLVSRRRCQPMSSTDFTPIGTICSKESVFICMKLNLKVKVPHPVVSCYCRSCCQKLGALIELLQVTLSLCIAFIVNSPFVLAKKKILQIVWLVEETKSKCCTTHIFFGKFQNLVMICRLSVSSKQYNSGALKGNFFSVFFFSHWFCGLYANPAAHKAKG